MDIANMTRGQLEGAIVEHRILPLDTEAQLNAAMALTDDEMRAAIRAWIEAGDECAAA